MGARPQQAIDLLPNFFLKPEADCSDKSSTQREAAVARQGRSFDKDEIETILALLRSTDLPIAAIAERMGCSRSVVVAMNRKYQVRDYRGRRSTWYTLGNESVDVGVTTRE